MGNSLPFSYSIYNFSVDSTSTIVIAEIFLTPCYLLTATTYVLPTLFFLNSIRYCTFFFKIVQDKISILNNDLENERIGSFRELKQKLNAIISDHQRAIELAGMLNKSIQFMMLVLCSQITASLCFSAFRFSIVSDSVFKVGSLYLKLYKIFPTGSPGQVGSHETHRFNCVPDFSTFRVLLFWNSVKRICIIRRGRGVQFSFLQDQIE